MERRRFLSSIGKTTAVVGAAQFLTGKARAENEKTTVACAGDCLVVRRVSNLQDAAFLDLVALLREADCTFANCEMLFLDPMSAYPGYKGLDPHVACEPWGADELAFMGIDIVGMANNHTMDFGLEGMKATMENLKRVKIEYCGAGMDLERASRAGYFDGIGGRVGLVSCASTFPEWSAAAPSHPYVNGRPGLNPLHLDYHMHLEPELYETIKTLNHEMIKRLGYWEFMPFMEDLGGAAEVQFDGFSVTAADSMDFFETARESDVARIVQAVEIAKKSSRIALTAIHSHEARNNYDTPPLFLEQFARKCIDAGADIFIGTGPHLLRGIEIYKGKPIFYSLGNFFFQHESIRHIPAEIFAGSGLEPRNIDPHKYYDRFPYTNDRRYWDSLVPLITFEGSTLSAVELYPITMGFGKPRPARGTPVMARGEVAGNILQRASTLSEPYGTKIEVRNGVGLIELS